MAMLNNQRVSVRDRGLQTSKHNQQTAPPRDRKNMFFLATKNHGDFSTKMAIQLTQMKS